jgi:uncharacterized membrane protein YqaE (UPF0057 family)
MKKMFLLSFFALLFVGQSFTSKAAAVSIGKETDENTASAATPAVPAVDAVSDAMAEFKHLSRKERKERFKEVRKEIKQFKADKKNNAEPSTNTLLLVILAILIPPLAVYLHEGEINGKFWLDLLLTLLFYVPGLIYALIVILGNG